MKLHEKSLVYNEGACNFYPSYVSLFHWHCPKMSKQLRQYYNFHKIVQFFMTQLCIWPRENTGLLYKLLPYLASLVCIFSVLKIIYFIICNISDIDRVSEGTTLVASITALSIKVGVYSHCIIIISCILCGIWYNIHLFAQTR